MSYIYLFIKYLSVVLLRDDNWEKGIYGRPTWGSHRSCRLRRHSHRNLRNCSHRSQSHRSYVIVVTIYVVIVAVVIVAVVIIVIVPAVETTCARWVPL